MVKLIVGIAAFIGAGLGLGAIFGSRWYVGLSLLFSLALSFYFGSVLARSRGPVLAVGPLEPDLRPDSLQFHIQVKNKGPGPIIPRVMITELTDGNGVPLMAGYSGWEAHWRGVPQGERPTLNEGDRKYVGILYVRYGNKSENPRLWSFPINHTLQALWPQGQEPSNGIRITFTVSSESKEGNDPVLQDERSYHFIPDSNASLGYSFRRLRLLRLETGPKTDSLSKGDSASLT